MIKKWLTYLALFTITVAAAGALVFTFCDEIGAIAKQATAWTPAQATITTPLLDVDIGAPMVATPFEKYYIGDSGIVAIGNGNLSGKYSDEQDGTNDSGHTVINIPIATPAASPVETHFAISTRPTMATATATATGA